DANVYELGPDEDEAHGHGGEVVPAYLELFHDRAEVNGQARVQVVLVDQEVHRVEKLVGDGAHLSAAPASSRKTRCNSPMIMSLSRLGRPLSLGENISMNGS